jgi:transcriptional regulator with XRE-family HTH domain
MAKRDRHNFFRLRLQEAMSAQSMTKSTLSRATGVDRSTIGQLLKNDVPRMPNAQLAADIAEALGISSDWLLGLTHRPEKPADILASSLSLSPAKRTSVA